MEVKTITYQRVKNLGNYESERCEMTAELNSEDDAIQCFDKLKNHVETALGLIPKETPVENFDEIPY